mgnify:CR=1 FL=1
MIPASETPRTDSVEKEANAVYRDGEWRAFSRTESKGWELARQLEKELREANDSLFACRTALDAAPRPEASFSDGVNAAAAIVERECKEDGEPEQLRNLLAAIRELRHEPQRD